MITFGLTMIGVAFLALVFIGGIKVGAKWFAVPRELAPVIVNFPVPGELQLARALVEGYRTQRAIITEAAVVPQSEFTTLPWSVVPSPARTFWAQTLVDDIQDLRADVTALTAENARLTTMVRDKDRLRRKHLAKIRELTPVAAELPLLYSDFERECGLKDGYHGLARSFAERITTAREAIASEAMRTEIDAILSGYAFPITEPIGVTA